MMHSVELKFGMYILGHHQMQPMDFGECIFTGVNKRILIHYGLWGQIIKSVLVSKRFRSIQLKFDNCMLAYIPMYCIDFGEFSTYSSFTEEQKKILIYYSL